MSQAKVLIVDDEPDIRELLEITLGRMGLDTESAQNLTVAKQKLKQQPFDLCLTDMRLPDGNGIDLVTHIQQSYAQLPVAVISAHGNMESAISALKAGAFDFVNKPVDLENLRTLVKNALQLQSSTTPVSETKPVPSGAQLLGTAASMDELRQKIAKLARSQAPVFIHGESGTGKELVAKLIHEQGPRADAGFIPVNCGAIPGELMESEFFGHKKGSFTGAHTDKIGLFQAAQDGTLFLDEVAELPLHMQVKLLRAIQEKAIRPVGAAEEIPLNVRILSASHKDLNQEVAAERFRQDLFYRINVIELTVPSLRGRPDDISLLAQHILDRLCQDQADKPPRLASEAMSQLQNYAFPGNVRELENILERALTLCEGTSITSDDLALRKHPQPEQGLNRGNNQGNNPDINTGTGPEATQDGSNQQTDNNTSLHDQLESQERDALTKALEQSRWNKAAAAKLLGMNYRQLRYRLKKLGID